MKRFAFLVGMFAFGALMGWSQNATAAVPVKLVAKIKAAHCQHPKWSANGSRLAYEVRYVRRNIIEIKILNLINKTIKTVHPNALQSGVLGIGVVNEKRGMVARELAWAPRGNKYLFSSNGTGTVYNVYLSQEGPLKANSRFKNDGQAAWSANGKYAVFTSGRTGKGDLYMVRMRGNSLKARRLTRFGNTTELFAAWSPKRNFQLAFVRHSDQSDRIYVFKNIFIPRPKRLTRGLKKIAELNPSWSPDGRMIAFYGVTPNGVYNLYVSTLSGKVTMLARNVIKSDQFGPAWAPNSRSIFYVQRLAQNKDRIYAVNVRTKAKRVIRTGTYLNNELAITKRGGKWYLAFTAQGKKKAVGLIFRKLYVAMIRPF